MTNNKITNKGFFYQIIIELRKLLTSKFMLILMILLLVFSIAVPIIAKSQANRNHSKHYYHEPEMDDLVIDGHVISPENPSYWELYHMKQEIDKLKQHASTPAHDLQLDFMQMLYDNHLDAAKKITSHEDYRQSLVWRRTELVMEKFLYENLDKPKEDLLAAIQFRFYKEPTEMDKYFELSPQEVAEKLQTIEDKFALVNKIIVENDHQAYYSFEIQNLNEQYEEGLERIKVLENDIIENPQNEEMYNEQIKHTKKSNQAILEIAIPIYKYRMDNDIVPQSDDWRDEALHNKQRTQYDILYMEILPQEEFEKQDHLKREFKSYHNYQQKMQKQIDENNKKLKIADKSLETGKPDMTYVPQGSRKKVVNFLWYSMAIAVFGAIIGGGLIAREFQSGTIRLLLIRPKTRVKLVLSKLFALLILCLGLYVASALLNMLTNGIMYGFSDFSNPNYTVSSGVQTVSFLGYFVSKFLICSITILFAVSTAYFLSVVTKNTALSVAIPLICFVGSLIGMEFITHRPSLHWVIYTPLPYVNLADFFTKNQMHMDPFQIQPILGLGIPMMIGLSVLFVTVATQIFTKKDITN